VTLIKRAVISVYNKSGLEELVKTLGEYDVKIVSSGGTYRKIKAMGYKNLVQVSTYTGHSESPGGLVKTLHPKIHGGLLMDRTDPDHIEWMKKNGVEPIDLVVSNLYPFEKVVKSKTNLKKAIDEIDIGGPTITRSAAKASLLYDIVCIVTDPSQYGEIIMTLKRNKGNLTTELRKKYALKAFTRTKAYDIAIVNYLEGKTCPKGQ
jgi:phosphoribosylaminoimidazolecarboxamide formyltransferase/IMP cyclohydrolase